MEWGGGGGIERKSTRLLAKQTQQRYRFGWCWAACGFRWQTVSFRLYVIHTSENAFEVQMRSLFDALLFFPFAAHCTHTHTYSEREIVGNIILSFSERKFYGAHFVHTHTHTWRIGKFYGFWTLYFLANVHANVSGWFHRHSPWENERGRCMACMKLL